MKHAISVLVCLAASLSLAAAALAQSHTQGPSQTGATNKPNTSPGEVTISLDDYLALLARISPAAREGALAYLQAFEARCGRSLDTDTLRRLVAEGPGDPVLMAMVHASDPSQRAGRDATLKLLAQRIRCDAPRAR